MVNEWSVRTGAATVAKIHQSQAIIFSCSGQALDKQKHRPNVQKFPKIVRQLCLSPSRQLSDIFRTFSPFFGHFVDIPFVRAVQRAARYKLSGCQTRCGSVEMGSRYAEPSRTATNHQNRHASLFTLHLAEGKLLSRNSKSIMKVIPLDSVLLFQHGDIEKAAAILWARFFLLGTPLLSTQIFESSSEQVYLNNFCWVSDSCHREEGRSSHEFLGKKLVLTQCFVVFLDLGGVSGLWVGDAGSLIKLTSVLTQKPLLVKVRPHCARQSLAIAVWHAAVGASSYYHPGCHAHAVTPCLLTLRIIGCTPRGSCSNTLLRRVLRRLFRASAS